MPKCRNAEMLKCLVLVVVCSRLAAAQFTQVSGTVIDPHAIPYANGTIMPTLVISGSPRFASSGLPYIPPTTPTGLDSRGSFVMNLADVTQLLPTGGLWTFTVNCGAGCVPPAGGVGPVSFTTTGLIISGTAMDISNVLQAAAPPLTGGGGGGGGGTVIQINGTSPGTTANFNGTTPGAPANGKLLIFQNSGSQISAALVGSGAATDCFLGTGLFAPCPGGALTVNGAAAGRDFNDRLPPIPPNGLNISWQTDGTHISGALVGDGIATHCFLGTGIFAVCPGGGGGGATLPVTPQLDLFASTGAGAAQASGVKAGAGHILTEVIKVSGAVDPSPFVNVAGATLEYFPTGAVFPPDSNNYGSTNGFATLFSHSLNNGSAGNGGVGLAGGNASGTAYQVYLDCELTGCDFKVPPSFNGSPLSGGGGGSMTWPPGPGIANYAGSNAWGTSYSSVNPIPPGFNQVLSLASGSAATPAVGFATAPELGLFVAPFAYSGGALQGFPISTIARASNVVTAVTSVTSTGLPVGATVSVSGVADVSFNGVFRIASVSGAQVTFNQTGPNGSSTGGIISPYMLNVAGYALEFAHLQSNSNGAATRGSIRLGPSDPIIYGCTGCTPSNVTGFGTTDQNLLTPQGSTGPVKLGDYLGVSIPGPLTIVGSLTTNMTGGPFCVHQTNGVLTTTGADCNTSAVALSTNGAANQVWGMNTAGNAQGWQTVSGGGGGGSGTVNTGAVGQIAFYPAAGTAVSGNTRLTDDGLTLTYSGAGHYTGNLTIDGLLNVRGPWLVNSVIPTIPMGNAPAGQSSFGISNDGNFYISANAGTPSIICTAANGGCAAGSMLWPAGTAAGIPNYSGSSSWSTTPSVYNASNQIPGNFISTTTLGTVPSATTAATATGLALSAAPANCTNAFPTGITASGSANNCTAVGGGLSITSGSLTTVGQQPYEIAVTVNGSFAGNQVFLRKPTSLAYTIPAGCTNSQVMLAIATTNNLIISLNKNGTQFGQAVINAGTTGGSGNTVWTCAAATSFAVGTDVLTIVVQSTIDATAQNFGGSFYATR